MGVGVVMLVTVTDLFYTLTLAGVTQKVQGLNTQSHKANAATYVKLCSNGIREGKG